MIRTGDQALLSRAVGLARSGRVDEAFARFHEYLAADPRSVIALNWVSRLLRDSGDGPGSVAFAERAARVDANNAETMYNLGLSYFAVDRFEESTFCLERSTKLAERYGAGFYALGCVYEAIGQPWQALIALLKNVEIDPHPQGYLKLAQVYLGLGKTEQAVEFGRWALGHPSTAAAAELLIADALGAGDSGGRAKRLARLGRVDEARELYFRAVEENPRSGAAYLNLVTIKRVTGEDQALVERLESLALDGDLGLSDRLYLQHALGKAFDDLGEYKAAMRHYDSANELNRQLYPALGRFDGGQFSRRVDLLIETFSREFLARHSLLGSESSRPIFIVGMMRSGTTLAEQILSSHSEVAAGGELAHWTYSERKVVDFARRQIHASAFAECVDAYLEILTTIDPASRHVTDKNPANAFALGLIGLAFPLAHVVYMARNPVDTALSIYMTPMRRPPEFGGSRENIVLAVREVSRLMEHWTPVFPLHRVSYEDLVGNQEETTRKLIEDCGLDWEEACLHPERNESLVGTPSLWQVRQPVNVRSTTRAERYGPSLGAFADLG